MNFQRIEFPGYHREISRQTPEDIGLERCTVIKKESVAWYREVPPVISDRELLKNLWRIGRGCKAARTHLICHTGRYMDRRTFRRICRCLFLPSGTLKEHACTYTLPDTCGRRVSNASAGKSDRSGCRGRQARFTVISFYLCFFPPLF